MTQITARIPDDLAREIDAAASELKRSRAQVVRMALEYYLEARSFLHGTLATDSFPRER